MLLLSRSCWNVVLGFVGVGLAACSANQTNVASPAVAEQAQPGETGVESPATTGPAHLGEAGNATRAPEAIASSDSPHTDNPQQVSAARDADDPAEALQQKYIQVTHELSREAPDCARCRAGFEKVCELSFEVCEAEKAKLGRSLDACEDAKRRCTELSLEVSLRCG